MKEEQKIYIRGSRNRPDDVRKILEQYGARVEEGTNFTLEDCIYYINHEGIFDYAPEGSELYKMITEYYHEVKLPNLSNHSEHWGKGDILVSDKDSNKFYIFDRYANDGGIFVYFEIIKSPIDNVPLKLNNISHIGHYIPCHKANDEELKTFYSILSAYNIAWDAYNKHLLDGNYTYFYPKNGHYYAKINTIKCKDRTTGEWYDAVLYSDANGQYVRELNDFNKKFKKIC